MTCSRPDISYVVSMLAQFMKSPTVAHLNLAKFVLKYLKGTSNFGLVYTFNPSENIDIVGFSDANWAMGLDRKSLSGYCFNGSLKHM